VSQPSWAGCYNGERCPVDLSALRGLDVDLSEDVLRVLRMDRWCAKELRLYVEKGSAVFEGLIERWALDRQFKPAGPSA